MRKTLYFTDALAPDEARRIGHTLEQACEQFEPGKWALVGSWATNYWLAAHDRGRRPGRKHELDIVTSYLSVTPPEAQEAFSFSHLHPQVDQSGHYAALVARNTGVKIDAFAPRIWSRMPTLEEVPLSPESKYLVPIINPVEQLVATVDDLDTRVNSTTAFGSHDKFFSAVDALRSVVDEESAEFAWRLLRRDRESRIGIFATVDYARGKADIQGGPPISKGRHILQKLTRPCGECVPELDGKNIRLMPDWKAALSMIMGRIPQSLSK